MYTDAQLNEMLKKNGAVNFNTDALKKDFTPTGTEVVGQYENDRNRCYKDLYKAIIREVYGVEDVICGHHLVYEVEERRADGFTYTFPQEIPAADTLIFDHGMAKKLWGTDFKANLIALALEPVETRDQLLAKLYYGRNK